MHLQHPRMLCYMYDRLETEPTSYHKDQSLSNDARCKLNSFRNNPVQSSISVLSTILIRGRPSGMAMTHWKSSVEDIRRIEIVLLPPELQGRTTRPMIGVNCARLELQ
jgi:hypothetical protein